MLAYFGIYIMLTILHVVVLNEEGKKLVYLYV